MNWYFGLRVGHLFRLSPTALIRKRLHSMRPLCHAKAMVNPLRRFALAALMAAACDRPPQAPAPADQARIVSLLPSTTEMLFALGAGPQVVGVDANTDYPAAATRITRIGGYNTYSIEAITALRPTLVVGESESFDADFQRRLAAAGLPTFFCRRRSVSDIERCVSALAERIGKADAAADVLAAMKQARESALRRRPARPPKTLLVVQVRPIYAVGGDTFVGELIGLAGGANILEDAASYPLIHPETVVTRAPEVIIVFRAEDRAYFLENPVFAGVPAVRDGRVFFIDDRLIGRPGPRIYEALGELAAHLAAPAGR